MAPTQKTGASSAVSPATDGSVPPSSSESGASLPSASGHTSAGNSALKALRQELAREPRQDLVRKNAFPDADKKSAAPQTATFEILKNYWCAPFPPPPVVAGFAARAALWWVAGLLMRARPARLHAGGLPGDGDRRARLLCLPMDSEPQCDGHPLPGAARCH